MGLRVDASFLVLHMAAQGKAGIRILHRGHIGAAAVVGLLLLNGPAPIVVQGEGVEVLRSAEDKGFAVDFS